MLQAQIAYCLARLFAPKLVSIPTAVSRWLFKYYFIPHNNAAFLILIIIIVVSLLLLLFLMKQLEPGISLDSGARSLDGHIKSFSAIF